MPFEVKENVTVGGVQVLELSGTMTMGGQLKQLEWKIEELIKNAQTKVVLDMALVTYLDSSAIGVLVGCNGSLKIAGGGLRLVGVTERVQQILKITGLTSIIVSKATIDEAVESLT